MVLELQHKVRMKCLRTEQSEVCERATFKKTNKKQTIIK